MSRLIRILKILAVNCLILAIGIVILELAFGGWLDTRKLNRLNLRKDLVYQYDVSELYRDPNPVIRYSRDKYGLRGSYGSPDNIDILAVGGSTTDQRFIRDGETWQDVLQERFRQTGRDIVVANAGVDGQSTYGHIENFRWWFPTIPDLAPDYIIFYIGLNDFHKEAGDNYDRLVKPDESFSLKQEIKDNSALRHMSRTLRGAYEAVVEKEIGHRYIDFSKVRWIHDALQNHYGFMRARLDEYADRLRMLADITRQFGARAIFVSQPSRYYRFTAESLVGDATIRLYDKHCYNGVDFYYMMRRLDNVTKAVSDEKNVLFVDLAGDTAWMDTDFYDFVHMTPQGARKVGVLLYDALRNFIVDDGQLDL